MKRFKKKKKMHIMHPKLWLDFTAVNTGFQESHNMMVLPVVQPCMIFSPVSWVLPFVFHGCCFFLPFSCFALFYLSFFFFSYCPVSLLWGVKRWAGSSVSCFSSFLPDQPLPLPFSDTVVGPRFSCVSV